MAFLALVVLGLTLLALITLQLAALLYWLALTALLLRLTPLWLPSLAVLCQVKFLHWA